MTETLFSHKEYWICIFKARYFAKLEYFIWLNSSYLSLWQIGNVASPITFSWLLKVLGPHFQPGHIWFMFGMMMDTGPEFLQAIIPLSRTLPYGQGLLMLKLYVKNASERKSAIQASCSVLRQALLIDAVICRALLFCIIKLCVT